MVRDGVANIVIRLQECGFDPRKVGLDSWESRCPAHRSADSALSITRNEHNHVKLECRSNENCQYVRIIGALGFTNDHVYAETPDWLISRLLRVQVQPAPFESLSAHVPSETASVISADALHESCPPPDVVVEPGGNGALGLLVAASMPCEVAGRGLWRLGRSLALPDNLSLRDPVARGRGTVVRPDDRRLAGLPPVQVFIQ